MKIKAISLWQPWASLIAVGAKRYETRSWPTNYRGPLLICSSKRGEMRHTKKQSAPGLFSQNHKERMELMKLLKRPEFIKALEPLFAAGIPGDGVQKWIPTWFLPFGKAVAIVDLVDCLPTVGFGLTRGLNLHPADSQYPFGDFSEGRFAWKLKNVRAIEPFSIRGQQGLFNVEISDDLLKGGTNA